MTVVECLCLGMNEYCVRAFVCARVCCLGACVYVVCVLVCCVHAWWCTHRYVWCQRRATSYRQSISSSRFTVPSTWKMSARSRACRDMRPTANLYSWWETYTRYRFRHKKITVYICISIFAWESPASTGNITQIHQTPTPQWQWKLGVWATFDVSASRTTKPCRYVLPYIVTHHHT